MLKRLILIGLLLGTTSAQATILVSLVNTPTGPNSSGTFDWVYDVSLQPNALLAPGGYFTIYDIPGLGPVTDASFSPDAALTGTQNWSVTASPLGVTPSQYLPDDSPFLNNVTVTLLSGDNIVPDQTKASVALGQLTLQSLYGAPAINPTEYTAQDIQQSANGRVLQNHGFATAPVPEPGTVGLLGFGLLGVAAVAMRRRSNGLNSIKS